MLLPAATRLLLLSSLLFGSSLAQTPPLSVSQREVNQRRYALSAHTTDGSVNCGSNAQIDTTWTVVLEGLWQRNNGNGQTAITTTGGQFSAGGTFTVPLNGVYYLSTCGRCERQACDVTMRVDGTRVAAYGTDLNERWEGGSSPGDGIYWSSHCVHVACRLTANQEVTTFMESGRGDDCLVETSFFYGQFNAFLYFADA